MKQMKHNQQLFLPSLGNCQPTLNLVVCHGPNSDYYRIKTYQSNPHNKMGNRYPVGFKPVIFYNEA